MNNIEELSNKFLAKQALEQLILEDMVNNGKHATDAYFGNVPEEKIKLLDDTETIVNEREVVK